MTGSRVKPKDHHLFFFVFTLVLSSAIVAQSDDCVYTAYVRTGSIFKGGTDSIISLTLYDTDGNFVEIPNMETWGGLMGDDHDYFERGNLDIFSGRAKCLETPVCAMNLTSDGSGPHHGWYCNYVEVTSTGAHVSCAQKLFTVEQWIARDAPPYELTAIRNYCPYDLKNHRKRHQHQIPSVEDLMTVV
ncbi:PLAT domain-containing protein 3-like [Telopea speciosissima]|uniref:PLAT domain-containing protein 3-like n=1 Tax=Telopea speciosissima TaxID=54955 RepID=UPI001CC3FD24|nr:PLAT domain-containing protein 3-like [Telopea speciosissima]